MRVPDWYILKELPCAYTGYTQKNGAVSKINRKFISHLTRAQRTPSAAATVQFPAWSSHWLAGTSQKRLTHSFSVVISHTRSTRTLAFTQASSFHKLSVPPSYVVPAWYVFSKPCTKLTLHCNDRSGHLRTEHTESLFLLRRHIGNWPRGLAVSMRSELLVAHEKLGHLLLLTV